METVEEQKRLAALAEYCMLDTPQAEDFDRITRLGSELFDVPIVLISLVDGDRQFFKSRLGIDLYETSRDVSFCSHAIISDEIFYIPDAAIDIRFAQNPLVTGTPFIRFYAGKPLVAPGGERLGTICLIDTKPRHSFNDMDRKNLHDLAGLVMDRMELRRLVFAQSISQARFEKIAATSPDAIVCAKSDGTIAFWNESATRLFGYSAEETLGTKFERIIADIWKNTYTEELSRLQSGKPLQFVKQTIELSGKRRNGTEFPAEFSFSSWQEGEKGAIGAIVRDITERRGNEERLSRLASLDTLTELSNRAEFRERLSNVLHDNRRCTLFLLDLDGFKEVNDTLGHLAGDATLREIARRIKLVSSHSIIVARLGGDEFAILMSDCNMTAASRSADRLVTAISEPWQFSGRNIFVGTSIGIAFGPEHGSNADELLNAADLALYRAKADRKGGFEFFEPRLRDAVNSRRAFEREIKDSFLKGEFELFYQPQVDLRSLRLTGAEALLRWRHPTRGLLRPDSFIDILSQKSSAEDIGNWILRKACEEAAKWQSIVPGIRISVNLFEAQLRSNKFVSFVEDTLASTKLPAACLELEIVENVLLKTDDVTLLLLNNLRQIGVGLALDDYGTGYASLNLLKKVPVSRLKIDKSFVKELCSSEFDMSLVKAIVYLATSFNLEVIAEGVEEKIQMDYLLHVQCNEAQGYFFGRPVPADEFFNRITSDFLID